MVTESCQSMETAKDDELPELLEEVGLWIIVTWGSAFDWWVTSIAASIR